MVKLTKDQINDVARLKHVFANNLDIAEDYYNQLIDGNPEPKVKESRLTELWQSENKTDKRDYLAHYLQSEASSRPTTGSLRPYHHIMDETQAHNTPQLNESLHLPLSKP